MNGIDLLRADHDSLVDLMDQYHPFGSYDKREKQAFAQRILNTWIIHERLEEDVFYPALSEALLDAGQNLIAVAQVEHRLVDVLLEEMEPHEIGSRPFESRFQAFIDLARRHMKTEEERVFPLAEEVVPDRLQELGGDMETLRQSLIDELAPDAEAAGAQPPEASMDQRGIR